jgi:hypothetical protein
MSLNVPMDTIKMMDPSVKIMAGEPVPPDYRRVTMGEMPAFFWRKKICDI